jgi:hypothetical protein
LIILQTLRGHQSLETTMIDTHLMKKPSIAVTTPLDRLDRMECASGVS